MPAIDCIRRKNPTAIITRCYERGCELRLDTLNNYIILKGEKVYTSGKICDAIIFMEKGGIIIGIVELKSRTISVNDIIEKFNNGSSIALSILRQCISGSWYRFYHLVLAQRWSTSEYKMITHRKITVEGKKWDIIPNRCRSSLSTIVHQ